MESVDLQNSIDHRLITEFSIYMTRGVKYILFGDKNGNLKFVTNNYFEKFFFSIFTRNGTLKEKINLGEQIIGLVKHHLYIIYASIFLNLNL